MNLISHVLTAFFLLITFPAWGALPDEVGRDLLSPATTPARNVLLIGGALALTSAIFEDSISDPLQAEATERRPIGHLASQAGVYASVLAPNAIYAIAMAIYGHLEGRSDSNRRALTMVKASIYSLGVTTAAKYLVREPRPDGSDNLSFPSGHTTSSFAFASVVQAEHGWIYGAVAYGWASLVAFGRMSDNRHFLHDVLAGATIGASYGLGAHYREALNTKQASEAFIQLLPSDDLSGAVALYRTDF